MDDFTWTRHVEHGGYWKCPTGALTEMRKLGWEPSDAPREPNPAVDERLAWQAEQGRAAAELSAAEPAENTTPTQPRRGKSE